MNAHSILETSTDDYPEITQDDINRAVVRRGLKEITSPPKDKQLVTILLDVEIIEYFKYKSGECGYQALINEVLRHAIEREVL
jgi:uncharacterized protein (DUF4415 family)